MSTPSLIILGLALVAFVVALTVAWALDGMGRIERSANDDGGVGS